MTTGSEGWLLADSRGAIFAIRIALVAGLLVAWEISVSRGILNPLFFGQPTAVGERIADGLVDGSLIRAAAITLMETLCGFLSGLACGTGIALLFWWVPFLGRAFGQFLVVGNAIPKVTLAPVLIVLLGVGVSMKIAMAFLNVVVFAALVAYLGMRQADGDLIDLLRSNAASRWQVFRHVVWPSSFAALIVSMKIGITLSFIGAVVGEFLAARDGLGYLAVYGAEIFNMNVVIVAVLGLMVLALCLFALVRLLEDRLLGWRPGV